MKATVPNKVKSFISDFLNSISRYHWIKKVYLFGSFAKGDFHKDSDIDIAVFVSDETEDSFNQYIILNKLVINDEFDVQIQVFKESELLDPCGIVEEVVMYGVDITH